MAGERGRRFATALLIAAGLAALAVTAVWSWQAARLTWGGARAVATVVGEEPDGRASPRPLMEFHLPNGEPANDRDTDGCYDVPEDWARRFVPWNIGARSLAVRVGLPGLGPCRHALTEVPLEVALPAGLRGLTVRRPPRPSPLTFTHRARRCGAPPPSPPSRRSRASPARG